MMTYLPALLPESALSNMTESPHCTLAVSNLPGPQTITKMKGFKISNITFWLPNRGSTGKSIYSMTIYRSSNLIGFYFMY